MIRYVHHYASRPVIYVHRVHPVYVRPVYAPPVYSRPVYDYAPAVVHHAHHGAGLVLLTLLGLIALVAAGLGALTLYKRRWTA